MMSLTGIKTIKDLELENQRVFIRVDFNVPLDKARACDAVSLCLSDVWVGRTDDGIA